MAKKPSYKELEQKIKELEREAFEPKRAVQTLQENGNDLRQAEYGALWNVFSESPIPTLILSKDGEIVDYNDATAQLTGYAHEEVPNIGAWMPKVYPDEEYRNKVIEISSRSRHRETDVKRDEFIITAKTGERRHVAFSVYDILHDGKPTGLQVVQGEDITERKLAEEALGKAHDELEQRVQERTVELSKANEQLEQQLEERKRAEERLTKSETFLNATGKMAKVGGWEIDGKTKKVFWTKEIHNITEVPPGYDPSSLDKEAIVFFTAEEQLRLQEAIQRAFEHNEPYDMELHITTAKGNKKWVQAICEPVVVDGKVVKLGGTFQDITERKRAGEALRESEERYRDLYDNAPVMYHTIDTKGIVLECNQTEADMLGHSKEEIIGKPIYAFETKEYQDVAPHALRDAAEKGHIVGERRFVKKDGTIIDIALEGTAIYDDSGQVVGFRSTLTNISHLKQAEQELRESELRYRSLFENSPIGIGLAAPNGGVLEYNDRMVQLTGYARGELEKVNVRDLYENPEDREGLVKQLEEEGIVRDYEAKLKRKDGTPFYVSLSITPVTLGGEDVLLTASQDITERKQAGEALRESEEKYRTILESIEDGYYEVDIAGNFTFFNDSVCRKIGYTRDELMGMNNREYMNEVTAKKVYQSFNRVYATGKPDKGFQYDIIRKDGTPINVEVSISLIRDSEGQIVGFRGIIRDVTERKGAEEALRESEHKYRTLLECLPQKMFYKDRNSVYVSCNENYARDLEIKPEDISGKTDYEFFPKELAEKYRGDDKRIVTLKKTEEIEEKYIQEGQEVWVQTVKTPVKDEKGDVTGVLGIFWDITERKKSEEELEQKVVELNSFINNIPDMAWIKDINSNFIAANKAFGNAVGMEPEYLVNHTCEICFGKEAAENFKQDDRRVMESRKQTVIEESITVDGKKTYLETIKSPIFDESGEVVGTVGVARDITQRKQAEEKLKQYSELLEDMVEERTKELKDAQEQMVRREKLATLGQVAGSMAHELRNPLGAIRNSAFFLNGAIQDPEQEVKEALEILEKEVVTSEKIIKSLLDFTHREVPIWRNVDINDIVQGALSRAPIQENVQVVSQLGETLPIIPGDPEQLIQAFGNLIINAVQAMPEGGRLVVKSEAPSEEQVTVSFTDTGGGMDQETLRKAFEPLFTTKAKGIGLGLALAKMVVEAHGGTIDIEVEKGKGSTFAVSLPTKVREKGAKILVVDDDKEIRDVLTEVLATNRPYQLEEASNGTEALIKLGTYRPNLLILDVMMPEMDGLEVCRTIRSEPKLSHMKVIIITGFPDHPKLKEVEELGFTNIHIKPIKLQRLLSQVDNALMRPKEAEI